MFFRDLHKFVLSFLATAVPYNEVQHNSSLILIIYSDFPCFSAHGVPGALALPSGPGSFGDVSGSILLSQRHIGGFPVHCCRYHTQF